MIEIVPKTVRLPSHPTSRTPSMTLYIIKTQALDTTRKITGDDIGTFGLSGSDENDIEWRYVGVVSLADLHLLCKYRKKKY